MAGITFFLCGDVMTGRGIDQILPHPGEPQLFEPVAKSARYYVELAERVNGKIPAPVDAAYLWGDALEVLAAIGPQARIINLETAVTASDEAWPGKIVHYRMHPANIPVLAAIRPDCCVLANNHVLDWGRSELAGTLAALQAAGLRYAGAGQSRDEAAAPACIELARGGRVLVFACAVADSNVPQEWAATDVRSGVAWLADLSPERAAAIAALVGAYKRPGDVAVLSIHWGPNWGYEIGPAERAFAHQLIDGGIDIVHGHSSHHAKGIEVYGERLILYGCGDFLNDYEGIAGYESFRPELGLMYLPTLEAGSGRLQELLLVPTRIARLRVNLADENDAAWLQALLEWEGRPFGTRIERRGSRLRLKWQGMPIAA